MSVKHTKGPWSVNNHEPRIINGKDGRDIARAYLLGTMRTQVEAEANARLIAAAPEMLEALILALPYVETAEADEGYKTGAVAKVSAAIRAAIAKAEGEP